MRAYPCTHLRFTAATFTAEPTPRAPTFLVRHLALAALKFGELTRGGQTESCYGTVKRKCVHGYARTPRTFPRLTQLRRQPAVEPRGRRELRGETESQILGVGTVP